MPEKPVRGDAVERDRVVTELESRRLFERIADMSPDVLYVYDCGIQRTIFISAAAERVTGYSPERVIELGQQFETVLWHPDDAAGLPEHQRRLRELADRETYEHHYRLRQPDGTYRWLRSRVSVFARDAERHVRQIVGIVQNITESKVAADALGESLRGAVVERRRAEQEAQVLKSEREQLTARLIDAQEMRSRHLARELHDVVSQKLAVLAMDLAGLAPHHDESRLARLTEQVRALAADIHQVSHQLHPAILGDLGLPAAIRSECLTFSTQHHMPVEFVSDDGMSRSVPENVSLCLYRVAQEALRNIGKHAGVSRVYVSLRMVGGDISLTIDDEGEGFDPDTIKGKGGLGLVSMEERLRMVGGTFSIRSHPGKGTHVEARVPF